MSGGFPAACAGIQHPRTRQRPDPLKKSTLVSIAVAFIIGIAAVVWVCYVSFKGSVMSFEATNAPGPLPTTAPAPPPPTRLPVPVRPVAAPTQAPFVFPTAIPKIAPNPVTPPPFQPNGPPPPDG